MMPRPTSLCPCEVCNNIASAGRLLQDHAGPACDVAGRETTGILLSLGSNFPSVARSCTTLLITRNASSKGFLRQSMSRISSLHSGPLALALRDTLVRIWLTGLKTWPSLFAPSTYLLVFLHRWWIVHSCLFRSGRLALLAAPGAAVVSYMLRPYCGPSSTPAGRTAFTITTA